MKLLLRLALAVGLSGLLPAATLERLSMQDMIQKSSSIVRGKVMSAAGAQRGGVIYTVYRISITEKLKGGGADTTVDVYVPGGSYGGFRQSFAGSPRMDVGSEYLVFVWTSPKGVNQAIGLSQGVFDVKLGTTGEQVLSRGPADAAMVDSEGRPVQDEGAKLTLRSLRESVQRLEAR